MGGVLSLYVLRQIPSMSTTSNNIIHQIMSFEHIYYAYPFSICTKTVGTLMFGKLHCLGLAGTIWPWYRSLFPPSIKTGMRTMNCKKYDGQVLRE
jgi:hypothetical protein